MLENFRGLAERLVRPLARLLLALRVPPDAVTWVGTVAVCVAAVITIPQGLLWQGAVLVGLLSLSDLVDGTMARLTAHQARLPHHDDSASGLAASQNAGGTMWGAFLDSSLDRIADGVVFGAILIYVTRVTAGPDSTVMVPGEAIGYLSELDAHGFAATWLPILALAVVVLGQLTPYVKARAGSLGGSADGGPGARADRIAIVVVALALEGIGVPLALPLGLLVLVMLGVVTVGLRMSRAHRSLLPVSPAGES